MKWIGAKDSRSLQQQHYHQQKRGKRKGGDERKRTYKENYL